ncbi:MAG: hypothetical protein AAGB97_00035 [Dehalococcoidia bacterium]
MYHISRGEQKRFALRSHRKAVAAQKEGRFRAEIVPVKVIEDDDSKRLIDQDQNPRPYTSLEMMAALEPIAKPDGTITSATVSFASDGATAVMLVSEERANVLERTYCVNRNCYRRGIVASEITVTELPRDFTLCC